MNLIDEIRSLPRERVFETVIALGGEADLQVEALVPQEWRTASYANVELIDQLARFALALHASDENAGTDVEIAIRGSGRKAYTFGAAEIISAGTVAVALLQVWLSRGRTGEKATVKITNGKNGPEVEISREVQWGLSAKAAEVLGSIATRIVSGAK